MELEASARGGNQKSSEELKIEDLKKLSEELKIEDLKKLSYTQVMAKYEASQPKEALKGVQENLEGLKNDLQDLQQMPGWLQDSLKGVSPSTDLQDQLGQVEGHVQGLQNDLAGLQTHIGGLTQHIGGLQEQLPGLQRHLPNLEQHAPKLEKQMGGLQKHLGGIQRHLPELQKHMRMVEALLWHVKQNKQDISEQKAKEKHTDQDYNRESNASNYFTSSNSKSDKDQGFRHNKNAPQQSSFFGASGMSGSHDSKRSQSPMDYYSKSGTGKNLSQSPQGKEQNLKKFSSGRISSTTRGQIVEVTPKLVKVSCHTHSSRSDAFVNTEQRFLRGLRDYLLQQCNIELTHTEWRGRATPVKNMLVLCLKISRLGTDVDNLRRDINMTNTHGGSNIVLVTFNHIAPHVNMGVATRDQLPEESRRGFCAMFDARCWSEAGGLYDCLENTQLIQDVGRYIMSNWPPEGVAD